MIYVLGVCLFLFLILLMLLLGSSDKAAPKAVYESQDSLFTPAERNFLMVLQRVCTSNYAIYGKVRLADLLRVRKGMPNDEWRRAFNKISAKHVDYVLCDPVTLAVRCVVELDDASHKRQDRSDRDTFLDSALKEAGIPIMRVRARASYKLDEVANQLLETIAVDQKAIA